jgi:hypothetical protein
MTEDRVESAIPPSFRINVTLNWQIRVLGVSDSADDYKSEQEYDEAEDRAVAALVAYLGEQDLHEAVELVTPDESDTETTRTIDLHGNPVD